MNCEQRRYFGKYRGIVVNTLDPERLARLQAEVPDGSPLADYRAALDLIVFAWNLSLMGTDERTAALRMLSKPRSGVVDATQRAAVREVERLMRRKQAMFPGDRRQIMSWQVRFKGDSVRVTAAALAE